MKKIKQYIIRLLRFVPDKLYLKLVFFFKLKYRLNLKNPTTFNEKLQWLKLYDRNPKYTKYVDKYEVREYIMETIGEEYLIPLLGVYNCFDEINFKKLPNQFVIKCTHDSGGLVICKDKKNLNIKESKKKIDSCLKRNYFYAGREWPYKNIKPRVIVEKYMDDKINTQLIDYKFMCFNGEPKMCFTCTERDNKEDGLAVTFYDMEWNKMPFIRKFRNSSVEISKPKNFKKMIELARKLSKDMKFVRVDFYEINNKIYFGELTFYPGGGFEGFTPIEWDKKIGNMINLEDK